MNTDELRRALDDLAGAPPEVDGALGVVTRRARRDRLRNRGAVFAVVACVIAATAFGVTRRSSPEHVTVRNQPTPPATGNIADLTWTRVAGPDAGINRIVAANGHTYALGGDNAGADVFELSADGQSHLLFHVARRDDFVEINDLIGIRGALVAVGTNAGRASAWRSTDNGVTWHSAKVEQPPLGHSEGNAAPAFNASISRIVASGDNLLAFGMSNDAPANGQCGRAAWTATDGASFDLVVAHSPVACGGSDATDGPAGLVVLEPGRAVALVGRTKYPIATGDVYVSAIAGDDHGYVAVGNSGSPGTIWWSADGKQWTRVATASEPDPKVFVRFTGVVHLAAGWIAVGRRVRPPTPFGNTGDTILWTSTDGTHWRKDARDRGAFEQFSQADGIGVTTDGVAMFGLKLSGDNPRIGPLHEDNVIWLGSSTPAAAPVGIIEGTLEEVGGPKGTQRPVAGSVAITGAGGRLTKIPVGADGTYSVREAPGIYHLVGHSPAYGSGKYACESWISGSDLGDEAVTVRASVVAHVDLECSVK